jgi:hypothetical protein
MIDQQRIPFQQRTKTESEETESRKEILIIAEIVIFLGN